MSDLEHTLRQAGADARRAAASALDVEADLQATLQRPPANAAYDAPASSPGTRRFVVVGAAAALVLLLVGGLVAITRGDDDPIGPVTSSGPTDTAASTTTSLPNAPVAPAPLAIPYHVLVDGESVGETWVTGLATDAGQLSALWERVGLADTPPSIDFGQQVVVYFGPAESSSCPFQALAGVSYSDATGRLYPELPIDGGAGGCTDDANPHAVVVAIDRDRLPAAPFHIWVSDEDPPACCESNVTTVTEDDLAGAPSPTTTSIVSGTDTDTSGGVVPSGSFTVGPEDLFVAHADGDLWLHPGILGDRPGEPVRVADFGDPREPVPEGPGPNVVEQVAGVYDGSVLLSDCCEPAVGNVYVVSAPDTGLLPWGFGTHPALSPDGERLAVLQMDGLTVNALDGSSGFGRSISAGDLGEFPVDLAWVGDNELATLVLVDSRYELRRYTADEATELITSEVLPQAFDPSGESTVSIAGAFDGTIVIAFTEPAGAWVEFRATTATGTTQTAERELSGNAREVRARSDGSLVWVTGDTLWYQSDGGEPRSLGSGFSAAWFASVN